MHTFTWLEVSELITQLQVLQEARCREEES